MRKEFKVELVISVESDHYPPNSMKEFVKSLFTNYKYESMVTEARVIELKVTDL